MAGPLALPRLSKAAAETCDITHRGAPQLVPRYNSLIDRPLVALCCASYHRNPAPLCNCQPFVVDALLAPIAESIVQFSETLLGMM